MELNREQVKKALGCCTLGDCYPCPYGNIGAGCRDKMCEDALFLINKQETEYNELYELCESYRKELVAVRADTVRKMQERLKRECLVDSGWEVLQIGTIDQIAKEVLEGANNG